MGLTDSLERSVRSISSLFCDTRPAVVVRPSWESWALIVLVVVGAIIRFWGVGSWGLENDEETMAMPTMHILQDGTPLLPSGMFYARGISQLYMMAAAVKVFGATEWALRFPSVICGLLLIVLVHYFGRRFLAPSWNTALVAIATFLPAFIADSQEARMYIFMLASLMGVSILTFKWEETRRDLHLVAAIVVMIVGLQFHVLTIFGAFIFLFPGLLKGELRLVLRGVLALLVSALGYFVISKWVSSFYPPHPPMHGVSIVLDEHGTALNKGGFPIWVLPSVVALGGGLAYFLCRGLKSRLCAAVVGAMVVGGMALQSVFFNHAGLLLLLAAAIILKRTAPNAVKRMYPVVLVSMLLLAAQFEILMHSDVGGPRKALGAMVGLPSVWPILRMAPYSIAAMALTGLFLAGALGQLSNGRKVSDFWLLFVLCVWVPLLLLGFFSWDVEARYTEFALVPLFVVALASLQKMQWNAALRGAAPVAAAALMINPAATFAVTNAGYSIHPDHKGAADFIKTLPRHRGDLVLAEDVNQQTYYLGRVDYWLIGPDIADTFSKEGVDGQLVDIYTSTPIISSAKDLQGLIDDPARGDLYIIGSGEQQEDGRRSARGREIAGLLDRLAPEIVYSGRDGLTKVWRIPSSKGDGASK